MARCNLTPEEAKRISRLISAKNIKDATDPRPAIDKFGIKVLSPGAAVECIRQRFFPLTAGDMQGLAERVLAPH
jgi:hypothetical protein